MSSPGSERLEEIRKRVEAATKGPWQCDEVPGYKIYDQSGHIVHNTGPHHDLSHGMTFCCRNASFIAHAREDVPFLLAEIEKRDEVLKEAVSALKGLLRNAGCDWYVKQFRRSELPSGINTGVAAAIHNREVEQRALMAYDEARKALTRIAEIMGCAHKNTKIWEPHLAGARKCLDCGMVYNPNRSPSWGKELGE